MRSCTHGEIGAYLMGLWGLPDGVIEAIAFHHSPDRCPMHEMTPLVAVHAANALCHRCIDGEDSAEAVLDECVIRAIGREHQIDNWLQLVREATACDDAA